MKIFTEIIGVHVLYLICRKSVLDGSAMVTTQKDLSTPPDVEENSVANYSAVEKEADVGGRRQQLARWSISDCAKHFRNTCYLSDTIKEHVSNVRIIEDQ